MKKCFSLGENWSQNIPFYEKKSESLCMGSIEALINLEWIKSKTCMTFFAWLSYFVIISWLPEQILDTLVYRWGFNLQKNYYLIFHDFINRPLLSSDNWTSIKTGCLNAPFSQKCEYFKLFWKIIKAFQWATPQNT